MRRLTAAVGGPRRAWAVVLLATALAISDADLATVGAVAGELERHLHISDVQVGVLATVTAVVGAIATIPVGSLTDRVPRVPLLTVSILLWSGAMVLSALSTSYRMLLISRMALGVVTATSGPTLASLTGDLFEPEERATVYGWIQAGEMAGAAFGLVAGGLIAGIVSWRASFLALALPAVLLALGLWRKLPEPARGGADRLAPESDSAAASPGPDRGMATEIRRHGVSPDPDLVLEEDPSTMPLVAAVRYVLSIPTNRVLILASALGYFFFTGVQTFAVVLVEQRFGVGQTAASGLIGLVAVGAVLGVMVGGRVADRRIARGHLSARISVGAGCYALAVALLIPALVTSSLPLAVPFFFLGAAAVTAANPPLDAARLDVVPDLIWGRAEGVRTFLRETATALAPLAFGLVSDVLGAGGNVGAVFSAGAGVHGDLSGAFLIMLGALVLSALILARGRRRFVRDVVTAADSEAAERRSSRV